MLHVHRKMLTSGNLKLFVGRAIKFREGCQDLSYKLPLGESYPPKVLKTLGIELRS